jgi:hypothetical protein
MGDGRIEDRKPAFLARLRRSWWLPGCVSIVWNWIGGALFGVLIAATDPVSVIAVFHEMKVERRFGLQRRRLDIRRGWHKQRQHGTGYTAISRFR